MKPRPDLNTLSKEVYEANKLKGFHDKEQSNETLLMLVICELSEAVEADRKGKRANPPAKNRMQHYNWNKWFEIYIKDTVEDELADAVIRLLDLAGLRGYDIDVIMDQKGLFYCEPMDEKFNSFIEHIYSITKLISGTHDIDFRDNEVVEIAIYSIEYLCLTLSIDLWLHVELKLKYNQSRPYKHGKAY